MSFLRKMFGSGVDTDDPRRYVIEAMLGAMEADGDVTEEELQVLEKNLEEHDLFVDLSRDARSRLIDMAADAIRDAGGGAKRAPGMAKGLASRGHRLTAYAMACEICVSDAELPESEIRYLEAVQRAFDIDDDTSRDIFEAARARSGLQTVEEKAAAMRELMPTFVDCMALMAVADGEIHDEEIVGVRAVLRQIPDMAVLSPEELDAAIDASFERVKSAKIDEELGRVAEAIQNPADRYWTTVYMMIIALADGVTVWSELAILRSVRDTFDLTDEVMNQAMQTATAFPAVELGGDAPG